MPWALEAIKVWRNPFHVRASPASETRTASYVNDYSNIGCRRTPVQLGDLTSPLKKDAILREKMRPIMRRLPDPLLCVFTVGSARPHLFRNSHLIPHARYSSGPFEWILYRGSLASRLAFWKSFVISFPDFRNRFTCVATPGNRKVDTLWIYYSTVGILDIFHVSS